MKILFTFLFMVIFTIGSFAASSKSEFEKKKTERIESIKKKLKDLHEDSVAKRKKLVEEMKKIRKEKK